VIDVLDSVLSYRDDEGGLRFRREELLASSKAQLEEAQAGLVRIYARRIARIAGGATAIAGAACITVMSGLSYGLGVVLGSSPFFKDPPLTLTLMATALLAPGAMLIAWGVARLRMKASIERALVSTSDVRLDVARLQHAPPLGQLKARIDALEVPSVWVPLMGWALVAPLSMHLMLAIALGWIEVPGTGPQHESFDGWILASVVLTAVGHAVLCKMAVRFARRLRTWSPASLAKPPSVWAPYGWTMLGACVPGLILYCVPPLIAAVTSLFIPVTFGALKHRVLRERALVALS